MHSGENSTAARSDAGTAAAAGRANRSWLLVTVDTEEDGLWQGEYRRVGNSVENLRGLDRFQRFCRAYGVVPTYLVDWPVVHCDWAVEWLAGWQEAGQCEVAAHLHPWCNPPLVEQVSAANSYLCNLPKKLQYEKLRCLTEAIERRFGERPRSFRAGRYGLDAVGARLLAELGYLVDSSVTCFADWSADGGPDFRFAPWQPYRPASDDLCRAAADGRLWEVPVSAGYNWRNFVRANLLWQRLASRPWRSLHLLGVLDRLGWLRQIRFSPEKAGAQQMKTLATASLAQGARCLVMILHSSSLAAGYSPYVRSHGQLEDFYRRMEKTFCFCLHERQMRAGSLGQFAQQVLQAPGDRQPAAAGKHQPSPRG